MTGIESTEALHKYRVSRCHTSGTVPRQKKYYIFRRCGQKAGRHRTRTTQTPYALCATIHIPGSDEHATAREPSISTHGPSRRYKLLASRAYLTIPSALVSMVHEC